MASLRNLWSNDTELAMGSTVLIWLETDELEMHPLAWF